MSGFAVNIMGSFHCYIRAQHTRKTREKCESKDAIFEMLTSSKIAFLKL